MPLIEPSHADRPDVPPYWTRKLSLSVGADVVVTQARHAAVAPSFSIRWVNRDLEFSNGFGRLTYQVGATVFLR
jgi:hypothetical protein